MTLQQPLVGLVVRPDELPDSMVDFVYPGLKGYLGSDIAKLILYRLNSNRLEIPRDIATHDPLDDYNFGLGKDAVAEELLERIVGVGQLVYCLGLGDAHRLIDAGLLREKCGDWQVLLWASTAYDNHGNQFVPVIQNIAGQQPVIVWYWLKYRLTPRHATFWR
ncbi:MAG: hypothetical protein AAB381_00425 [Patescibacteria group bacterium]